ncbi:F0F1 ATP synthase subunit epsilon [Actinobacillus pleuropneumoniae]|uniref:ATP synthase epsilon chain n=4 Tax=Actinobacillus pleuropneumoniae TaxID=715 RepID=ATPE_ACTP7|nr:MULTISPECIES: F0F1 ATP synthase subunit epsilon [Actinobacillus]B0BRX1.1 RecName: Full=ATP synthase epsilon chain; AltName: Full=ATP synthase F1 sector epsilon subunit; AltName: Full=F-ATPase epsilon subunit [Actinobacillus pleuropneumoniae serovar 3 str. JL03]B3H2P2.1 RecName: Full=ATP synthase epsilon chain; AltName: Full=ATP synthase F1 sector epsilon subunit; AltName: Full=F-ATPase epsilon subunit [Actinobacillus pleuropneumoniae serovar 7 str. AP76]ABY70230.1 ATP synthase epsilon chain [
MASQFELSVVSAEKEIFNGNVVSVRVTGIDGELGVYAGHTPLLTSIKPGMVKYTLEDGKEEFIYVSGGFLEVQPTIVTVLADVAIRGEELDQQRILAAKRKAEDTLSKSNNAELSAKLSREIAKLRVYEIVNSKLANRR